MDDNKTSYVPKYSIYLRDLPSSVNDDDLVELFSKFGTVHSTNIVQARNNYGFVNYLSEDERTKALDSQNTTEFTIRNETVRAYRSIEKTTLFLGGLPNDIKKDELQDIIEKKTFPNIEITLKNGFAFVKYSNHHEAAHAIELLKNLTINDNVIKCSTARSQGRRNDSSTATTTTTSSVPIKTVYVRNLAASTTEEQLQQHFKPCGNICSCTIAYDNKGVSKGFGFVEFDEVKMCENAISTLNGSTLNEVVINVDMARRATGGGGGGGGSGTTRTNAAAAAVASSSNNANTVPPTTTATPNDNANVPLVAASVIGIQQQQQLIQQQQPITNVFPPYHAMSYTNHVDPNVAAAYAQPYNGYSTVTTYNYPLDTTTASIGAAPSLMPYQAPPVGPQSPMPINNNDRTPPPSSS